MMFLGELMNLLEKKKEEIKDHLSSAKDYFEVYLSTHFTKCEKELETNPTKNTA